MTAITPADLPDAVRKRAVAAGARDWLDALPALVNQLEREWSIRVGSILAGGSEALVAEATCDDGSPAVLKVLLPEDPRAARNEITALQLANGDGCALLLRADVDHAAMLLERLGEPLGESSLGPTERREALCAAAERLWRRTPDAGFPTGAAKGRWLIEFITSTWEKLGRPCSEAAVDYALRCAERRIAAHDDERAVLVHGDIHEWNALEAASGYKLIDPDGLLAEAEYDLGVIMRQAPISPSHPRASAGWLAQRTGRDETAIWDWAAVERLSTALVCTDLDLQPTGQRLLEAAELAPQFA